MNRLTILTCVLAVTAATRGQVVISEIMYNPASPEDNWEWVELYNVGVAPVNLAGYVIDDNNNSAHSSANIASGSVPPGGTAVLYNADDVSSAEFAQAWGAGLNLVPVTGWTLMQLNNGGDTLGLWSGFASYSGDNVTQANVIDQVPYDDVGPWPIDDGAASIYWTGGDNSVGSNWSLSSPTTGTTSTATATNSGSDVGSPGAVPSGVPVELLSFTIE